MNAKVALYCDINKIKINPETGIKRVFHEDGSLEILIFYQPIDPESFKGHKYLHECIRQWLQPSKGKQCQIDYIQINEEME